MEEFLNQTRAFLGVIQAIMSEEEKERSSQAADEMYEQLRQITNKHELNIREMLNTQLALGATVLQLAMDQMEDVRNKEAN
ncbi:hypothetical protein SAMN02799624_05367 [Paenibacillus sp. UNC496MF]|uniref:hypothetical protein n=1 Tax=Paenibacillus sp. UNC496MF TaxID=1502753 RepID=UPI0008E2A3FE|nr:hypothetical protein [Paenibacillus sp. UNC496MF]SFJ64867.1 hypothetical protein SAMN02799624_05367 [Paenibacillus sp. UNC496MF]